MKSLIAVFLLASLPVIASESAAAGPPSLAERVERTLNSDDKPFALVTQLYIARGEEAKFEAAAIKGAAASRTDPGCLAYEFHRDLEKPNHYFLIERWTGLAPLRKHLAQQRVKDLQAVFDALSTTPRTTDIVAPVDGRN
jgi:quinol monooxygenase YgiN